MRLFNVNPRTFIAIGHDIVVAALKALSEEGKLPASKVAQAIAKYGIKADKVNPLHA